MRKKMTPSEARLWSLLKGRQAGGLKFRRQHPFPPYVLDFYCAALGVAVEVDGASHHGEAQSAHDERREAYLNRHGVRVLHVPAGALQDRPEVVVEWIVRRCSRQEGCSRATHPSVPVRFAPGPPPQHSWGGNYKREPFG
jgi:very-short-patch-repair endonuclease